MAVTMTILVEEDFTTSNLVGMFVHNNLNLRVQHVYPNSTAKHSFYLIHKNQGTIRFAECWLGQEENSEWSFSLYELPAEVFLFLLNKDHYLAQESLDDIDSYMIGSVESYGTFDMYKHRQSNSPEEITNFVGGDWWLPK